MTEGPTFAPSHVHSGGELSHTYLMLLSDQDGRSYHVAIDNGFAPGYDAAGERVPAPLSTIRTGDRLELCGKLLTRGGLGIDWVHTNCGKQPRPARPDGWLKILTPDGSPGPNLEDSEEYCRALAVNIVSRMTAAPTARPRVDGARCSHVHCRLDPVGY